MSPTKTARDLVPLVISRSFAQAPSRYIGLMAAHDGRWKRIVTGEWVIRHSTARKRRMIHYWLTMFWLTVGLALWLVLRQALWFVGFMSLYAIWFTHIAGWAAETPVEEEDDGKPAG
jgi:hypothetical protein